MGYWDGKQLREDQTRGDKEKKNTTTISYIDVRRAVDIGLIEKVSLSETEMRLAADLAMNSRHVNKHMCVCVCV